MLKKPYDHHPKQRARQRDDFTPEEVAELVAEFEEKNAFLASRFRQLSPREFVRGIFPEGSFEKFNDHEGTDQTKRKANGILSILKDKESRGRKYNRILFDDLAALDEVQGKEFVILSPVAYSGRRRDEKNAYLFYGLAIDLDEVDIDCIKDLIHQAQTDFIPFPTYIVNSGTGLHVYYIFETPVPALSKYYKSFSRMKADLSNLIWNHYTSNRKQKQVQGIFQGYRVPGTQTKIREDCIVTAFEVGGKVTINQLNSFVSDENKADFDEDHYISLKEIEQRLGDFSTEPEWNAEKWRAWYERRIEKKKPVGNYRLNAAQKKRRRAWYEAWKKKLRAGAFDGNRYFCICVLFNYAMKARIPKAEARKDALDLVYFLDSKTERKGNNFTKEDVKAAEQYYDRKFIKMSRAKILQMTKIDIGKTKRRKNPWPKSVHVEDMRETYKTMKKNGIPFNRPEGRPKGSGTKADLVRDWRDEHPNGRKIDCERELHLSRHTVLKWW